MTLKHTPWGPAQHATTSAPGIVFYSTASHGGYHLSPERQRALLAKFNDFTPFAGAPWYEEDQDCAVVVLAFPDLFEADKLRGAVHTARYSAKPSNFGLSQRYPGWESVVAWLDSPAGATILRRVAEWEAEHANDWEYAGGSTICPGYPVGCWNQRLIRIADGLEKCVVLQPKHPYQHIWTDADITQYAALPVAG